MKTITLSDQHAEMVLALLREERETNASYDREDVDCVIGRLVEVGVEYSPLGGWPPQ